MPRPLTAGRLADLSTALGESIGLHFPQERWADLERGVWSIARELGLDDAESCAQRLIEMPRAHQHVDLLARHLTIGETYFFREAAAFAALEQDVLPLLLSARASDKRLRLWSAACCTGEEPYSLALLLDRSLPGTTGWRASILATDINPTFLRTAQAGVYGAWSFRNTPRDFRDRHFQNRGRGRYELAAAVRRRVKFALLNLAEDTYPSVATDTVDMDLILCRNVLMYFEPARAARVVASLRNALVDGGWLLVSSVEAASPIFAGFEPVWLGGALIYRKISGKPKVLSSAHATRPGLRPAPVPELPTPVKPSAGVRPHPAPPDREPIDAAVQARQCANAGQLAEAAAWAEKAVMSNKLDVVAHYLLANVRIELGQLDEAARSLRRALYIDQNFVLAHFSLASLRCTQGRSTEGGRHLANALKLLQDLPPEAELAHADGLTAGQLAAMAASLQARLRASTAANAIP